ncbi:hypothetical protein SNOG_03459 [Parastagonospora nodorum SN15]|uniref:Uncharacterized protein n=1 Tax=Phaeosphaeria nodorum (strain SN15 / ATCC MYA-4574 / FGSC 10173) TaxID=321614 RepID=Q0UXQ5_PHANO|nr:hypothetical protein SNOG_03459 [Parastagonospora nodorum SN15]EAT88664.1 hypothetical protein SNOG_03459 [Parastagonospora nodorum SN15]
MTTPPSPTTTFHKEPSPAAVHMGNTDSGNSPWQPNAPFFCFVANQSHCGWTCFYAIGWTLVFEDSCVEWS